MSSRQRAHGTLARARAKAVLARSGALALLVGFGLVILSSCGARGSDSARLTVGTFWGGHAAEALHRELLGVAREMGTVTIEVQTFSFSGFSEYLFESQPRMGSDTLDLIVVPNDWLGRLWQRRLIAEVPQTRLERVQDELVRQAMITVTDADQVLGFPIAAEVLALVYDPTRFPAPPTTLDEIVSADLPDGVMPLALDVSSPYYLAPLMSSRQGLLVDSTGAFVWSTAALRDVLERLRPVWGNEDGWKVCRGRDLESLQLQLFTEGRLASFFAGPWLLDALEEAERPFAVTPIPPFVGAPYPPRALIGYQCVAVSRNSPWVDLALEIAATLCRRDVNERLNRGSRRLPVLLSSYQTQKAIATPGTVGFLRALEDGQLFPSEARWSDSFQRASERLQRFASQNSPPTPGELESITSSGGGA